MFYWVSQSLYFLLRFFDFRFCEIGIIFRLENFLNESFLFFDFTPWLSCLTNLLRLRFVQMIILTMAAHHDQDLNSRSVSLESSALVTELSHCVFCIFQSFTPSLAHPSIYMKQSYSAYCSGLVHWEDLSQYLHRNQYFASYNSP